MIPALVGGITVVALLIGGLFGVAWQQGATTLPISPDVIIIERGPAPVEYETQEQGIPSLSAGEVLGARSETIIREIVREPYYVVTGATSVANPLITSSLKAGKGLKKKGDTIRCDNASDDSFGCLSPNDFENFQEKLGGDALESSEDLLALVGDGTGSGALVFGTGPTLEALKLSGITSSLLATDASGEVVATTSIALTGLSVTGGATSTFQNGVNLVTGCFAVGGVCITGGGGGGGIDTLNGLIATTQNFATGTDANIRIAITSSGSTHTFTPSWNGTLAISRGGTGTTTAPSQGQLLLGNASGGYDLVSTSSLGIGSGNGTVNSGTTGQIAYYAANGSAISATSSLTIESDGDITIGTTTSRAKLTTSSITTSPTNSYAVGSYSFFEVNPSSNQNPGARSFAQLGYSLVTAENSSSIQNLNGTAGWAENYDTSTVNRIAGLDGWGWSAASATVSEVMGAMLASEVDGGTVTHLSGATIWNGSYAGTVTNQYGIRIDDIDISGAAVTNRYGIKIETLSGTPTNDYGIYQEGISQKNFFAGNVGIGTTSPYQELSVNGDLALTGRIYDTNASAGSNGMILQTTGSGVQWVATSSLGIASGASTFLALTDTPSSYNDGRILFESSSAVTDSANLTFSNSILSAPILSASGASSTALMFGLEPLLRASSTAYGLALGRAANGFLGSENVAIGADALGSASGTSAMRNTAIGSGALAFNQSGSNNTALGQGSLYYLTTGASNIALGYRSLERTDGDYNIGIGELSLASSSLDSDSYNLALGYGAGRYMANGSNNIFMGYQAGSSLTSGSNNIAIGHDVQLPLLTGSNQLVIGNIIYGTGLTGTGATISPGNIGIGSSSPNARLAIDTSSLGTSSALLIGSSTRTVLTVTNSGNLLLGTTSITGTAANATSSRLVMSGGAFYQQFAASGTAGGIGIVGGVQDAVNLNGPRAVVVSGRYAYVVNEVNDSFRIIDVSNPNAPVVVGGIQDSTNLNGAYGVAVSGQYAYIASNLDNSVRVIDVSNPTVPVMVGGVKDDTNLQSPRGITVAGSYAYVTNYNDDSFRIIDVSNPNAPVVVGGIKAAGDLDGATDIAVVGRYAYVVSFGNDSLRIFDVSNPVSPVRVGAVQDNTNLNGAFSVAVSGRYAYVANTNDNSLRIIDISNSASPSIVGGIKDDTNFATLYGVTVRGRYAYVAAEADDSLHVVDVSNPTAPVVVSSIKDATNLNGVRSIAVAGRYAYVAAYTDDSLRIIDLGGIDTPAGNIGSLLVGTIDSDVLRSGNAFLASLGIGQGGLYSQGAGAFSISATTSLTGTPALSAIVNDTRVSSVADALSITHTATGTIAAGIGTGLLFNTEFLGTSAASTTATSTGRIASILTDVTAASPQSALAFYTKSGTTEPQERMRLTATGALGIGTSTPNWTLQVASSATPYLALTNMAGTLDNRHWLLSNSGDGMFRIGTSSDNLTSTSTYLVFNTTAGNYQFGLRYSGTSTGSENISIGNNALRVGGGIANIALGDSALIRGRGSYNIAIGSEAIGNLADISSNNVAVGDDAMDLISSANDTVAIGFSAMKSADGNYNVGVGRDVGLFFDGSYNTLLGYRSGYQSSDLYNATSTLLIGAFSNIGANISTSTAIGYNAYVDCSQCMVLGGTTTADIVKVGIGSSSPFARLAVNADLLGVSPALYVGSTSLTALIVTNSGNVGIGTSSPTAQLTTTGSVRFATFGAGGLETDAEGNLVIASDERLKNIEGEFTRGIEAVLGIAPISYRWKEETGYDTMNVYTGFRAQNIQEFIPEAVGESKNGFLTLSDRPILAAVINAIKEIVATLDALKERVTTDEVQTERLCVGDVCVTETEFMELLENKNVTPQPADEEPPVEVPEEPVPEQGSENPQVPPESEQTPEPETTTPEVTEQPQETTSEPTVTE